MILSTLASTVRQGLWPITSTAGYDQTIAVDRTRVSRCWVVHNPPSESLHTPHPSIWVQRPTEFDEWVYIEGQLNGTFSLRQPIDIHIWREGDEFVADVPELNLHAFGDSPNNALGSLAEAIIEQLNWLESLEGHISPSLLAERTSLHSIVRVNDAEL